MATKVTEEMYLKTVENNSKIQNLQKIRNADFLTNPIEIINNNAFILINYVEKEILTGKTQFKMNTLLITYIFNALESFSAFKDKKMKLIIKSKITEEEKNILRNVVYDIEGTDDNPKTLKVLNAIRNRFHHHYIKDIQLNTTFNQNEVKRELQIEGHLIIPMLKTAVNDAQRIKDEINKKIDELIGSYNVRDNILRFNAYCRSNGMIDKVFLLFPEETEEELALYC